MLAPQGGSSMKVLCLGGGPAGLYFAISMKLRDPSHEVTVLERNKADDTFGWGIVFSDKTMGGFREADAKLVDEIERNPARFLLRETADPELVLGREPRAERAAQEP